MKRYLNLFLVLVAVQTLLFVSSCQEDEVDTSISVIKDDQTPQNDLDRWLLKNYVEPYNVKLRYRWEDNEINMDYILVPVKYECAIKMANAIKYICFDAFEMATGSKAFIRNNFPKMIQLVGNPGWSSSRDGSYTLGSSEGGYRIDLWYANHIRDVQYDKEELNSNYFHTIIHEFGHTFHQKVPYPTEFTQLSGTKYRGAMWNNYASTLEAQTDGFITPYASCSADEDFAEIFTLYILSSNAEMDNILRYASGGATLLQAKIRIMKEYFQTNWDLDVDDVRDEVLDREDNLLDLNFDDVSI